jgi:tetratricopeptide (TPR) repeat protein
VRDNSPTLASSEVRVTQGQVAVVAVKRVGDDVEIKVKIGDRDAFTHKIPWDGEFGFVLGCRGQGAARFDDIVGSGKLSQSWVKRTTAAAPNEIARFMNNWQGAREVDAGNNASGGQFPFAFRQTSAEDPVALEGVRGEAIKLVADGRAALAQQQLGQAIDLFRKAYEKDPNYFAAGYLYSIMALRRDPDDLFRVERALKGVEDFYEAMVLKGDALINLNQVEQSKALLAKALELRPDYPPAYLLKANLFISDGKYVEALNTLELANVLGPGDPFIIQKMGEARALAEGPAWADRKRVTTKEYIVDTDYVDHADRFARVLDAIRARYVEAFPNLVNPDAPKRAASVLVFNEAEDYYNYSEQTTNDRMTNTGGHFNPRTGQLLLFLDATSSAPGALHVLQHEAMHQWAHAQQLALPYWANEGMAEYIGGTTVTDDGRITERAVINSFLKDRLKGMTDWRASRMRWNAIMTESPQEFYSGRVSYKYGQGWAMIHYFMESGDRVTVEGEERPIKDIFMDYLNKYKAIGLDHKSRGGSRLEYVYVDTFHQIDDLEEVEKRFGEYVCKLAEKVGVKFLSEEEAKKVAKVEED